MNLIHLLLNIVLQIPHCTYRAVNFRVSAADGSFICQWAREWELAHQFECMSLNAPFKDTSMDVEQWFEKTISGELLSKSICSLCPCVCKVVGDTRLESNMQ